MLPIVAAEGASDSYRSSGMPRGKAVQIIGMVVTQLKTIGTPIGKHAWSRPIDAVLNQALKFRREKFSREQSGSADSQALVPSRDSYRQRPDADGDEWGLVGKLAEKAERPNNGMTPNRRDRFGRGDVDDFGLGFGCHACGMAGRAIPLPPLIESNEMVAPERSA